MIHCTFPPPHTPDPRHQTPDPRPQTPETSFSDSWNQIKGSIILFTFVCLHVFFMLVRETVLPLLLDDG